MWNNLPNPHSSLSPLPFTPVRDIRLDLWTYRLLRSLQSNASLGQLVHCPYYRPFSALDAGFTSPPFLLGADHYFEWRSLSHLQPLCLITFCISPVFDFPSPKVHFGNSIIHACPTITILSGNYPLQLQGRPTCPRGRGACTKRERLQAEQAQQAIREAHVT